MVFNWFALDSKNNDFENMVRTPLTSETLMSSFTPTFYNINHQPKDEHQYTFLHFNYYLYLYYYLLYFIINITRFHDALLEYFYSRQPLGIQRVIFEGTPSRKTII